MTSNTIPFSIVVDNLDALNDALDILFYYEGDDYDFLAEESVVSVMVDDWGLNASEAQGLLAIALEIHDDRCKTGFYN